MAVRTYNYKMGFAVNGTPIPDPTSFSGANSSLDLLGKRDATGSLHRKMVATKIPTKISWENMAWDTMATILPLVADENFTFTYPDPNRAGQLRTMTAYCGDREWDVTLMASTGDYVGKLSFSVIEV